MEILICKKCYLSERGFIFCPLHAAAPELLAACKKLIETCGHQAWHLLCGQAEYIPDNKCHACIDGKRAVIKASSEK